MCVSGVPPTGVLGSEPFAWRGATFCSAMYVSRSGPFAWQARDFELCKGRDVRLASLWLSLRSGPFAWQVRDLALQGANLLSPKPTPKAKAKAEPKPEHTGLPMGL